MSQTQTSAVGRSSVTQAVIEAIAEAEGTDPVELTSPLYEVIDPDALDQLFAPTPTDSRMNGQVVFTYYEYEVTVSGDGYVSIEKQDE